ncbi:heavy metal sensor histidine kinase [Massilia sp. NEAU-DD11]|uniref:Sensor protein n=1 Tax=Massilia cellulosiltytica TaxID=2683234 RepID=A0A7X3K5U8_9BURK|nr:heavy metal sensor histidine kinase [Telluria cellulosilytica]MVW59269.1 heavy metal sensor histidine kinase [Telluria cellulosilytica]
MSIALRLGLLFAAIAAAVFVAVGAYLYQTLAHQMGRRDDADLLNKAVLARQLLGALPTRDPALLARAIGQDGVTLQVRAADGSVSAVPLGRDPGLADIAARDDARGSRRVVTVLAGAAAAPLQVTLVRTRSDRLAILRRYAFDLLGALVAGTLVAAALGFAAVKRGLRPLYGVIARADAIHAQRLAVRMPAAELPAELRALAVAFNAMLDRLEEGVQRLSGFAADLAHDLRTPVNALMMQTQVALARVRTANEYEALLASNLEEYERLARMIENTLFLARADNAQLALASTALDVRAELEHIREYFEMLAEDKGIRFGLGDVAGLQVRADPVLLRRAVNNLVSNAIAHTPRGGAVNLGAASDGQWVTLSVENSGDGIAPEHLERVFERYYRADAARGAGSSVGLGLSIVRAIMRLHGGTAEVDSVPGGRTVFSLRFPS